MFKAEDAVSVDTTEFELTPPGVTSRSRGVVLAVTETPRLRYYVRVRLPFGSMIDLSVDASKVAPIRDL